MNDTCKTCKFFVATEEGKGSCKAEMPPPVYSLLQGLGRFDEIDLENSCREVNDDDSCSIHKPRDR